MQLTVHPLSSATLHDFLYFFEHTGFTDHPEWRGCYCMHFHWDEAMEETYAAYKAAGGTTLKRDTAIRMIHEGTHRGYLAYADGEVAGWCGADDKRGYAGLAKALSHQVYSPDDPARIKAVVCFLTLPRLRGMGIAKKLLMYAIEDASREGYACLEAYPYKTSNDPYENHHGPYALYENLGFALHRDIGGRCVMRKTL